MSRDFLVYPDGCAWYVVRLSGDDARVMMEQAEAETHIRARDALAGMAAEAQAMAMDRLASDESLLSEEDRAILAAAVGMEDTYGLWIGELEA